MMRISRTFLLVLLAAVMIFCIQSVALAAEKPYILEVYEFPYKTGEGASNRYGLAIHNFTEKNAIKNLKSSDPSVVKAAWTKDYENFLYFFCLKPGTSTISGVFYENSKKVSKFKIKVTVYQYEAPVKTFKLGSKNYASKFKDNDHVYLKIKKTETFKVSIKPNKGWKLEDIEFYDGEKRTSIKNNSKVTCKNSKSYVNASFRNEKTGRSETIYLYITKDE